MKSIRRVRHHAGTKTAPPQSVNAPKNPSGKTSVTLGTLQETPSGYTGRIAFSGDIYLALGTLAVTKHAGDWNAALCDVLGSALFPLAQAERFPLSDFEAAIQDASAAIESLLNKVIVQNERSAHPHSPDFSDPVANEVCGYYRLAKDAKDSLAAAFHGVHQTLYRPARVS